MLKFINLRNKRIHKTKSIIYKNGNNIRLNQLGNEKYKILLLLFSIVGILLGAISYKITINSNFIQIAQESFIILNSGNFKVIFLYLFKINLIFYIFSFFIGTSFIGSFLSVFPPTVKCIYIGFLSGYLYNEFELKGVLFCLLLLYPCFSITTASLIYASNENMYMSQYVFNCLTGRCNTDNISIKLYLIRYLLLFTIVLACISITSFLISVIGPKINIV